MSEAATSVMDLLLRARTGDPLATEALIPVMYGELRRLAEVLIQKTPPGGTLQATSLVHEAFLRLVAFCIGCILHTW